MSASRAFGRPWPSGLVAAAIAVGAAVSTGAPAPAATPDPFYTGLMRDGRTALLRGDAAGARRDLRVACFGLLDSPPLLGECRVRLAIAEGETGDKTAFLESFSRIEEIERQFVVYADLAISPEERAAFEARAAEWIEPELLRSVPVFAPLVARRNEADLAKLSPRDRTQELERRMAAEPKNARWRVELANDDLGRKRPGAALGRLEGVPDGAEEGAVGCARGRSLAELDRCAEAIAPLAACRRTVSDAPLAELLLTCYSETSRAAEAREFAARLAPAVASRPEIRKRLDRLPKTEAAPKPAGEAAAVSGAPASRDQPGKRPAAPAAAPPASASAKPAESRTAPAPPSARPAAGAVARPSAEELRTADRIRNAMRTASSRAQLEADLPGAQALADRYPGDEALQLLAGELAYRAGRWATGVTYLGRASKDGPTDPTLRFYLAVCQFENGSPADAALTASKGLDRLPRSAFVDSYLKKFAAERR